MLRGAAVLGVLLAARVAAAAPPVELRASRGIDGVVAAGGIDLVTLEVTSGADVPVEAALAVDGRAYRVAIAARGRGTLVLGRPVPAGASTLPAVVVRTPDGRTVTVPPARVVARPVVVIADDVVAAVRAFDGHAEGAGAPVAVTPERAPARWQALAGAGAIVVDRPADALPPAVARAIARHLGAGGRVCRVAGDTLTCARPPPVALPRTRVAGATAAAARALAWGALGLAGLCAAALALPRGRGIALGIAAVAAAAIAIVRVPDTAIEVRGVRVEGAAPGEAWVAAELGAGAIGEAPRLDGDLWIEPSIAGDRLAPLAPLDGRIPGTGSWRVRGFVPAGGGGWAARLAAVDRVTPGLP